MTIMDTITVDNVGPATSQELVFTLASCILMANNKELSPQDAVQDVMQVYRKIKAICKKSRKLMILVL